MGNFEFISTPLKDLILVETKVYKDDRGFFKETYSAHAFQPFLDVNFVQDNTSLSVKGVLRGLHYQQPHYQGKLVRVVAGQVYDVAVDLRKGSPTYGQYYGVVLSEDNHRQLYIPEGFAHGFLTLSETAKVSYKCTTKYYPHEEKGLHWNDQQVGIPWPLEGIDKVLVNERDDAFPTLEQIMDNT